MASAGLPRPVVGCLETTAAWLVSAAQPVDRAFSALAYTELEALLVDAVSSESVSVERRITESTELGPKIIVLDFAEVEETTERH
jgi:hypothetical protein